MRSQKLRQPLLALAVGLAASSCSVSSSSDSEAPVQESPDVAEAQELGNGPRGELELHFGNPLEFGSPADRCAISACQRLVALIDDADESVDFAIYGIRHQSEVAQALIRAKERGVAVRGVVDRTPDGANYYSSTDELVASLGTVRDDLQAELDREPEDSDYVPPCPRPDGFEGPLQCLAYDLGEAWLIAGHASVEDFTDPATGNSSGAIMHHKFFVIDNEHVWTGSMNLSDSGTGGYNANLVVVASSPELAEIYRREFERLYLGIFQENKASDGVETVTIGSAEVATFFSPQDSSMTYGVRALIARAQEQIDIAMFFLTHKEVTADLIAAHKRGVEVRVLVDATSVNNGYTKHEILREAGIPVKVENWGGKMHAKAMVVDDAYLVAGSMNWTKAGSDTNDENTLLIRSPSAAREFSEYFQQLWDSVPEEWMEFDARPAPESWDSGTSCVDGVDNDFDDLADADDPSCLDPSQGLVALPPHRLVESTYSPNREGTNVFRDGPPAGYRSFAALECDDAYPQWFVCVRPFAGEAVRIPCARMPYRNFNALSSDPQAVPPLTDPWGYDGDGDGLGCEQNLALSDAALDATVQRVVDGDTLVVEVGGGEESVRLLGIDAPEREQGSQPAQCFSAESTQHLEHLLPTGTRITLVRDTESRDRYGRILTYVVRAEDQTHVNLDLVQNGYATVQFFGPNRAMEDRFESAEAEAKLLDLGLWKACEEASPAESDEPSTAETPSTPPAVPTTTTANGCHPAYSPCIPNLPGDALNCGDLTPSQRPVRLFDVDDDPYKLDGNNDGVGCS